MSWIELHCNVDAINLVRRDWEDDDEEAVYRRVTVTMHLDGFPSDQTLDLVFKDVEPLAKLGQALTELASHPFTNGRTWRSHS